MKNVFLVLSMLTLLFSSKKVLSQKNNHSGAVRVVVAGTSHGHAAWILDKAKSDEMEIVGIYEPDKKLAEKNALKYHLDPALFFNDLDKVLELKKPEAVLAFGSIKEHLFVVQVAAPKGIHIMVEKPLAVNLKDAEQMKSIADKNKVLLLTNFETSWYPSTYETFRLIKDSNYVGQIRKVVFHHGHQGPKEIGVGDEFFNWLTDPIKNGGGAIVDFGCYGANLITYLMNGQLPISVTAVTNQFKPGIYPHVDDDATIILNYPKTQAIIQASWNWTFSRKDMEVYGDSAYIVAVNANKMRLRNKESLPEYEKWVTEKDIHVYTNPFSYLHAVLRGKERVEPFGLYSLENNLIVDKILDAAKLSATTGKTVMMH
jgi:predicted dehydrogenase